MNPQELAEKIATAQPSLMAALPTTLQRYLQGESLQVLAKEHSMTKEGLRKQLKRFTLTYTGQEWHDVVTQALAERIADADEQMEEARDLVQVAIARAHMQYSRMDYERRRPSLYGPKQEMSVDNKVTVIVQRQPVAVETPRNSESASQVLDVIPEKIMDNSQTP